MAIPGTGTFRTDKKGHELFTCSKCRRDARKDLIIDNGQSGMCKKCFIKTCKISTPDGSDDEGDEVSLEPEDQEKFDVSINKMILINNKMFMNFIEPLVKIDDEVTTPNLSKIDHIKLLTKEGSIKEANVTKEEFDRSFTAAL